MTRIIGLLVLFLATLTLGGCAGLPYDLGGGAAGYGYGGSYPQPYGGGLGAPGYGAVAPPAVYVPQPYYAPQPYYSSPEVYAPAPPPGVAGAPYSPRGGHMAGPWVDHREREQAGRIRQGLRDGSLTPHEAQRRWGEQRHIRGAEGRMSADGNPNPRERGRLNAMQNRASQDIYRGRHNGMVQPGAPGPQIGNGHAGSMGSIGQRGSPGPQGGTGHVGPAGKSHSNNSQRHESPGRGGTPTPAQ